MRIGVLSLQGDFQKHLDALGRCGVEAVEVRTAQALDAVDGLIIPGGESTTVGRLMARWGLDDAIASRAREGMPIWGTCTGLILLAQEVEGSEQSRLGLMDITVRRNAFGRQVDSFEADLKIEGLESGTFRGVFVRAPIVTRVGPDVEVLARVDSKTVFVRQGNLWGTAFHPELTEDLRLHQLFADLVESFRRTATQAPRP